MVRKYDRSMLSAHAFRSATQGHAYQAFGDPCEDIPQRKGRQQRKASTSSKCTSSPARTARTQLSSTCSMNNSFNSKAELELDLSVSSDSFVLPSPPTLQYYQHLPTAFKEAGQPNEIRRVPSNESLSKLLKNVSSVGKNVIKSLRKNMSLVKSSSFDSGISSISRRSRKKRRNKKKSLSLPTIPRDVKVSVVDGEDSVEMVTKQPIDNSDWGYYSSDSECDNHNDNTIKIPKIIRDTSTFATSTTFATTSLTSGEDAKIYQDGADIRKLCSLMEKIRSSNSQDDEEGELKLKGRSSDNGLYLNSNINHSKNSLDWSFASSQDEIEVSLESFRANISKVSPLQPEADSFVDLMIFVNNEQKVLEFTADEF